MTRLIAALDTPDRAQAAAWAAALASHCALLKLGLEYILANGPSGVAAPVFHAPVFLDLKLHDIPNTVAGAVRSILPLHPAMLTLHAAGGSAMLEAARREAGSPGPGVPILLGVTVLTSLDETALHQTGVYARPREQVLRLARVALAAGLDGLVCSAHELAPLRDAFGQAPVLVVPGIRPAGAALADQARSMTPRAAAAAGADYIVVGRPITRAADPAAAAAAIAAELAS